MKLIEIYKGATIEQHEEHGLFCATFNKSAWYGWCNTVEIVKAYIDAREMGVTA